MLHSNPFPEVPQLVDFNGFAWHCALKRGPYEVLTLSKIEGNAQPLPDTYMPPSYALEFMLRGTITGRVNNRLVELQPNDAFFCVADHIHQDVIVSPDAEYYVMGFTTQIAEELNIHISQSQLAQILMHPSWHISETLMPIILQHITLLRMMIEENQHATAVLNVVRSLILCLAQEAALQPQQTYTLTRAEQICGHYLSLVETHCREHHRVEWYASQMHLSAKYLSNVLKQTLNTSPNAYIQQALIRQAKSLLSSTSLSIQQIADRLGFQNQSHFGTLFKRSTRLNPSTFRSTITC